MKTKHIKRDSHDDFRIGRDLTVVDLPTRLSAARVSGDGPSSIVVTGDGCNGRCVTLFERASDKSSDGVFDEHAGRRCLRFAIRGCETGLQG